MALESNIPPGCILIVRSGCPLNEDAVAMANSLLDVRHVLESDDWDGWKDSTSELDGEFVLNFLSHHILRGPLLSRAAVNFHPAPPEYPGRCTASYALFDEAPTFGATAHTMAEQVDTGEILLVKRFSISPSDTCEGLSGRAEQSCLDLLNETMTHIRDHAELPPPCGERWRKKPFTRKDFEKWLILDPNNPEIFERKILSARHSKYPGPYVILHGHRFSLDKE